MRVWSTRAALVLGVFFALPLAAATNPVFTGAYAVSPTSGIVTGTTFRWTTSAKNADGSPIIMTVHIVNPNNEDVAFAMNFSGGSTAGGANFYKDKTLSYAGLYRYYFVAASNAGGQARYPAYGTFSGPTSTQPLPDLISSWLNVPIVAVSGQPVVLQGQVMNAGSATAGASTAQFMLSASPSHSNATGIGAAMSVPSLGSGASSGVLSTTWWPPSTGVYYVTLRADRANQIAESNESNNDYSAWSTLTAGDPIASGGSYKIGVVLISAPALTSDAMTKYMTYLDQLKRDVASGKPHRQRGNTTADFVVQLEVRWDQTQPSSGVTAFDWYDRFATECRLRGIRWTPLLSTHYVPGYIKTLYAKDQLKIVAASSLFDPYQYPNLYLKHGPSSTLWRNDAADWAAQFVRYMAARGHLGPNGVIDEILIGNELMFPSTGTGGSPLTSQDDSSVARWKALNPQLAYPTSFTDVFRDFRGRELGRMLQDLITRVKNELAAATHGEVGVSTKLVPYKFFRTSAPYQAATDRYSGYTPEGVGIAGTAATFAAIDSYPAADDGSCGGVQWHFSDDLAMTRAQLPARPIYVTELNLNSGTCGSRKLQPIDIYRMFGQENAAGGRYLTLFALNSNDATRLTSDQLSGLRLLFDALVLP